MRKWSGIVLLVGISGVLLAFLLAQMPYWRSTSSGIVVDVDDPRWSSVVNTSPVPRTALACHTTLGGE